jgi:hypothetical protein
MNIQSYKSSLGMLMTVAAVSLLGACAEQLTPDAPDTTEQAAAEASQDATLAMPAIDAKADVAVNPAFVPIGCRKVTAASIPVFTTAAGSTVRCTFLRGDIFQYQATFIPNNRAETWCPRHTPLANGVISWAQAAGTVADPSCN